MSPWDLATFPSPQTQETYWIFPQASRKLAMLMTGAVRELGHWTSLVSGAKAIRKPRYLEVPFHLIGSSGNTEQEAKLAKP